MVQNINIKDNLCFIKLVAHFLPPAQTDTNAILQLVWIVWTHLLRLEVEPWPEVLLETFKYQKSQKGKQHHLFNAFVHHLPIGMERWESVVNYYFFTRLRSKLTNQLILVGTTLLSFSSPCASSRECDSTKGLECLEAEVLPSKKKRMVAATTQCLCPSPSYWDGEMGTCGKSHVI